VLPDGGLDQRVAFRTHQAQDESVEQPWGTPAFSRVTSSTVNVSVTGNYLTEQVDYIVVRYVDATKTLTVQNRNCSPLPLNFSLDSATDRSIHGYV
jgi:hypothetical protein